MSVIEEAALVFNQAPLPFQACLTKFTLAAQADRDELRHFLVTARTDLTAGVIPVIVIRMMGHIIRQLRLSIIRELDRLLSAAAAVSPTRNNSKVRTCLT
jgi:hypothetical protein